MILTIKNQLTGRLNTMAVDVTPEQIERWRAGALIQDVMPHLSTDEREFLITGMTPEEWDEIYDDEEKDI